MTLEKTKKPATKIKKSQLQKQKQTQNVIVNLNAPVKKATRKRPIKKPPQLKPVQKTPFQSPIYMPPIASFNPPKQPDNSSILSDILKHINKPVKPEPNELEKPKPEEREPAPPPAPTLPTAFGPPDITEQGGFNLANTMRGIREGRGQTRRPQSTFDESNVFNIPRVPISLVSEIKSDPTIAPTFIRPIRFEAPKEPFKFNTPLPPEPKPPTLVQTINVGQEKKFEPQTKQPWSELETGGHFVLPEAKATPTLVRTVIEEARPTSEEIDLGIVPPIAGEIVQEDRVENDEPPILQIMAEPEKEKILIKEPIATRGNTEQMQLKELTMGEDKSFNKTLIPPPLSQFFVSRPQPSYKPTLLSQIERSQLDAVKEARIKALDKPPPLDKPKPLLLKREAEPIISTETNQPLSPEKEVVPDKDPEIQKLKKFVVFDLKSLLISLGGRVTWGPGAPKNKNALYTDIIELRKKKPVLFTGLLKAY